MRQKRVLQGYERTELPSKSKCPQSVTVILRLSASYCQMIQMLFYQKSIFPSVLRGISQVASQHQYAIQIATGKDEKERMTAISQMVHGRRVDGLIFLTPKKTIL